jgi:hypothetical protein
MSGMSGDSGVVESGRIRRDKVVEVNRACQVNQVNQA